MRPVVGPRRRPPPRSLTSPPRTALGWPGLPFGVRATLKGLTERGHTPARSTARPQRGRRHDRPALFARHGQCGDIAAQPHLETDARVQGVGCMGVWCSQQPLTYSVHAWLPVSPRRARAMRIGRTAAAGGQGLLSARPPLAQAKCDRLPGGFSKRHRGPVGCGRGWAAAAGGWWAAAARGLRPRVGYCRAARGPGIDDRGHARGHSRMALWRPNWRIP